MDIQEQRRRLSKLATIDIIEEGYTLVIKIGATTPDGIKLRAILSELFKRAEP